MTEPNMTTLKAALDALPKLYPGPGGIVGVVKDGQVIASRAWGHANVETGAPLTVGTRLPICSISKQFTCAVLLDTIGDPARLDDRVAQYLPAFTGERPTVKNLCDNQSGLRDYWALTILHGAMAEQTFAREDALPLIARMKTGHFAPGTSYSYCNCNFRIVAEMIETETGKPMADLYRDHIWGPAGMKTAVLTSDTRHPADGVVGYEGSPVTGYMPADNGIFWIGDAGISASLTDMLAYECWIDATRDDDGGLYRRLSAQPMFRDGNPASYGYGLTHETVAGVAFTGHGGALRGFRLQRMNARSERLSVVVMFNHEGDAHGACHHIIKAALGASDPAPRAIADDWDGQWLDVERGMTARLSTGRKTAMVSYATKPAIFTEDASGALMAGGMRIDRDGAGLIMAIPGENTTRQLQPLAVVDHADGVEIAGQYHTDELGADMQIEARDGGVYVRFLGMLGQGRMERLTPAGRDVWTMTTRRSMDAPAPGEWTLMVRRDADGRVTGATLGCWLARGVTYDRL